MLFILFLTFTFLFLFHQLFWKRRHLPPGPIPIPFIGNALSMMNPPPGYVAFNKWSKQYGGVYTFWIGSDPFIMISTYDKLKETFIRDGDTYVDKKQMDIQEKFRGGSYGILETNGPIWRDHRRFALTNMRDFGLGKDLMQEKILIEVEDLFKKFDASVNEETNIMEKFDVGVANVINQVIFGYRFEGERKEEFVKLKKLIDFQNENMGTILVMLKVFVPHLEKVLPGPTIEELFKNFKIDFYAFFNTQIENHRKEIDFDSTENSDYVEAYLKEQRKREEAGDTVSFSNAQLTNVCFDIWFAGLATTTTTLSWGFAYLLHNMDYQDKIHEELDRVIGSDRLITMSDKNNLPYMQAFINETQRCGNILPINVMHMTTKDTTINGHFVKKGTGVIAQISTVMMDEKVFPDPERFDPNRFIENGTIKKIDELIPFSIGKRQCLGEGLARMELFLFFANFFNRYRMTPSKVDGPPSIDKTKESGVIQRVFNAVLQKRY